MLHTNTHSPFYFVPKCAVIAYTAIWMVLFCSCFNYSLCQSIPQNVPIGGWRSYVSHKGTIKTAFRQSEALALSTVGLVSIDVLNGDYTEYTQLDGLNDNRTSAITYSPTRDEVFIGYETGLIDYFRQAAPGKVRTIRDIQLSRNVINKKIYDLALWNNTIIAACDFGLVLYDLERQETRSSVFKVGTSAQQKPILDVEIVGNRIWVIADQGAIYSASLENSNIADPNQWRLEKAPDARNASPQSKLRYVRGTMFLSQKGTILKRRDNSIRWDTFNIQLPTGIQINDFQPLNDAQALVVGVIYFEGPGYIPPKGYIVQVSEGQRTDSIRIQAGRQPSSLSVSAANDYFSVTDLSGSFDVFRTNDRSLHAQQPTPLPNNNCQDLVMADGELYVAPLGHRNFNEPSYDENGVYYMNLSDRNWKVFHRYNGGLDYSRCNNSIGIGYFDAFNYQVYMSSWNYGYTSFQGGRRVGVTDTASSPCLTGILEDSSGRAVAIRIAGFARDQNKQLWHVSTAARRPITVFDVNNVCYTYALPPALGLKNEMIGIEIDDVGNKWITLKENGILIFNENGTLENSRDDRFVSLRQGTGNGGLPSNGVNRIKKDNDGAIWVCTDQGVSVFYNPSNVFDEQANRDAVCPIYQQRCLLSEQDVTAIAIDGANRKWFGTANGGVFLFSADGTTLIQQFTTENSNLNSNTIFDIEIDQRFGEVFFATDRGIVSYVTEAIQPAKSNDALRVFPNPVPKNFDDWITIRNTTAQSKVKITSVDGLLVRELETIGGQALWDGKDIRGNRVHSGVYLVFLEDKEGLNGGIAKITILDSNP
jgi:hypothetical protein